VSSFLNVIPVLSKPFNICRTIISHGENSDLSTMESGNAFHIEPSTRQHNQSIAVSGGNVHPWRYFNLKNVLPVARGLF
jgi:hypothetical protein